MRAYGRGLAVRGGYPGRTHEADRMTETLLDGMHVMDGALTTRAVGLRHASATVAAPVAGGCA